MKRGTPEHPKTMKLCSALEVSRPLGVGLLEMLWHFTGRFAPRGDIGRWSNKDIAEGVGWQGDPDKLISALLQTGWIDSEKTYRLLIHDWSDHCDQAVRKYLQRNKLRFASKSGRRPSKSGPESGPPLPLPLPLPLPTDNPPLPPTLDTFPQAVVENGNGNGHPPDPPASAGGQQSTLAADVKRLARLVSDTWCNGEPLGRPHLRLIRNALKSTDVDDLAAQIRESEYVPQWLVVVQKARI